MYSCVYGVWFYVMWSTQCSFKDCTLKTVSQSIHKFPLLFSYSADSVTRICCCCCSKPLLGMLCCFCVSFIQLFFPSHTICSLFSYYRSFSPLVAGFVCDCKQPYRWECDLSKYSFEQNMRTEEAAILREKSKNDWKIWNIHSIDVCVCHVIHYKITLWFECTQIAWIIRLISSTVFISIYISLIVHSALRAYNLHLHFTLYIERISK